MEEKLINEFGVMVPGYRLEKSDDEGYKLLQIDGIETEDGREDVWIATVYEMDELLTLLNQQKRPEGLNAEVGSANKSASTTDTNIAYSSDFVHRLHVLVCKILGLDDEDHEDDNEAEPLEKAIMQLFDTYSTQARIDELQRLDTQAVWSDSRLNGYLERRFIELAPSTTKHNTSKE